MIATKTRMQPTISLIDRDSPSRIHPPIAQNTASRLIIKEAIEGITFFCPSIWNVYATPQDKTPVYKSGIQACKIDESTGLSNKNIDIKEKNPQTKN